MQRRGRQARPAYAALVEMLDETGRAHPGLHSASIRVGGPIAAARAEYGIAHEPLGEQGRMVNGIHSAG